MGMFSGTVTLNKKVILIGTMIFLFTSVVSASSINGEFEGNPIVKVKQNGKELNVQDVPAVILNGRTMVPIYMLEQLGASVEWDSKSYSVDVNNSNRMFKVLEWLYVNNVRDVYATSSVRQYDEIDASFLVTDENYIFSTSKIEDILYNLSLTNAETFLLWVKIPGSNNDKKVLGSFRGQTKDVLDFYAGKITDTELFQKVTFTDLTHKGNEKMFLSLMINSKYRAAEKGNTAPFPVTTPVPTSIPTPTSSTFSTIESKIDGDFEGYDSDNIYKLLNGQIWKQTSFKYGYHYSFMPDVIIYSSGGVYKMKVDGMDDSVTVERLK
ncbi:stalk domain-containing protein [Paenibacillus sp. LjRoot56]|uniref:stalk domain-containing protein n=1 Tax=Paenibacillus sp. LjRoot56 TaxID=3342333 RepID=UPI003ECF1C35